MTTWFTITHGRSGYDVEVWAPGDHFRRTYERAIAKGLRDDDWSGVSRGLRAVENHAAVLIGDARGERFEDRVGWIRPNQRMAIASASKLIAALAVHRVVARFRRFFFSAFSRPPVCVVVEPLGGPGTQARTDLELHSPVGDYVDAWTDDRGTTRLAQCPGNPFNFAST